MGRIFVIAGGLLVLLLTAALVIPPFVNWSGYRAAFEQEASRILGRPVHVTGDVNARLLPFPSVAFTDVRVGADPNTPDMAIDAFTMDAELMPFLSGKVLIFDMRVDNPVTKIRIDRDGRIDWAIRPTTPIAASQIRVERLSVNNGKIILSDEKTGRTRQADNIFATMSASSLAGPWQASGSLMFDGQRMAVDFNSGEAKPEGLGVRLRIAPDAIPATFETDGNMALLDGRLTYSGTFGLRSADVSQSGRNDQKDGAPAKNRQTPPPADRPFLSDLRLTGQFTATRGRFELTEFRMEQGPVESPYVVNGKAFVDLEEVPRFKISADGQQIFWGAAESAENDQKTPYMDSSERFAILRRTLQQLPIPSIPGDIDLRLPAVIAGGTTIRSVTISAEPVATGWNIHQFQADLPGRTRVEAKGLLNVGAQFGFDGDLLIASRQPSGLAAWLDKDVDEAVRRLPTAGLSGRLQLRDGLQRIDDMELALADTTLKGSFRREAAGNAQPAITIDLQGEEITSDALYAGLAMSGLNKPTSLLDGQALNLTLKAGPVQMDDLEADAVDIAVRLHDGRINFDRFMVSDLAGATLTATGALDPSASQASGSVDATLLSDDLGELFVALSARFPQWPVLRALAQRSDSFPGLFASTNLNIIVNAAGPARPVEDAPKPRNGKSDRTAPVTAPSKSANGARIDNEFSFTVAGTSGDMKLDLAGTAINAGDEGEPMQIQLNSSATAPQGEAVLALLGVPALPLGLAGELTADMNIQGSLGAGMRTQLTLTASDGKAMADGVISLAGGDIAASGKAMLKSADLQPFIATTGFAVPGFGEGLPVELTSDFQFAKEILRFPNLTGKVSGEPVTARIEANFVDSGWPMLKGEAKLASLELDSLAAVMLGQDALEPASGKAKNSIWSRVPFAARSSLPLLMDLKLTSAQATTSNFGTIADLTTRLEKSADTLKLSELSGKWAGGFLQGDVSLQNSDKNALLAANLKWGGANLAAFYQPEGHTPLRGEVQTSLYLNGSGGNVAELMSSLAGTANVDVKDLTISGLNSSAFAGMLAASETLADQPGEQKDKLDSKQFAALTDAAIGQGEFSVGNRQMEFTIAGGIARMKPLELSDGMASLASDLQLDFSRLALAGTGNLTFVTSGKAQALQPQLAIALAGTFDQPVVTIDRQALVQYLTQHMLEREQQRVEAMQASLIEKQQLRRELGRVQAEAISREKALQEEESRRRRDGAVRLKAQQEAQRQAEQAARAKAEAAARAAEGQEDLPSIMPKNGQSLDEVFKELQKNQTPLQ